MVRAAQRLLCALALLLAAPAAHAQDAASFFRGKTVRLMVGATPGGGFQQGTKRPALLDLDRLDARHLSSSSTWGSAIVGLRRRQSRLARAPGLG